MSQHNPLSDTSLETREDFEDAVVQLFAPLRDHFTDGRALVSFPGDDVNLGDGIEGYARPLWGLAPHAAGGGECDWWPEYRRGLVNGTDPEHPEYWGKARDWSFHAVEMSAIGVTLAMVPDRMWDPLSEHEREHVAEWLASVNGTSLPDNNWHLFRVLVNLGLESVGAGGDWDACAGDFDRIEEFAKADGWYADGSGGHCDYYTAWAIHTYALLYARFIDEGRSDHARRAERYRERAARFAPEFAHWFDPNGRALPYGRSLIYRFAQAAFWGALAVANVEPDELSWGQVRGLWQRNVAWWADQPIAAGDGRLVLGYRYPTNRICESYNAPQSPYWAMKAFLPLCLPADHPFWTAAPEPLPDRSDAATQRPAGLVLRHDTANEHTVALTPGQDIGYEDKYDKFAYSTRFGFGVPTGRTGVETAAPDNTLLVARAGTDRFQGRRNFMDRVIGGDGDVPYARWMPLDGVEIETWLVPATPWHVRVHRIESSYPIAVVEGGYPVPKSGIGRPTDQDHETRTNAAIARFPGVASGIRKLSGDELDGEGSRSGSELDGDGDVVTPTPGSNVLHRRTAVPVLADERDAGTYWSATGVTAGDDGVAAEWDSPPAVSLRPDARAFSVETSDGAVLFSKAPDE